MLCSFSPYFKPAAGNQAVTAAIILKSIFYPLDQDLHGYVTNISPMKLSPAKVSYFHAKVTGQTQHRVVSFSPKLMDIMEKCNKKQVPVKISRFRRTPNKYDESKEDIILSELSHVKESNKSVEYNAGNYLPHQIIAVKDISDYAPGEKISMEGYKMQHLNKLKFEVR